MDQNLFLAPASKQGISNAYDHLHRAVIQGIRSEELKTDEVSNEDVVRVWGVSEGSRKAWDQIKPDDWVFFYVGEKGYRYACEVIGKEHNPELGDEIRSSYFDVSEREDYNWVYLIYLSPPVCIDIPGPYLSDILGYKGSFVSTFLRVATDRLGPIKNEYGDIQSLVDNNRID